jgi:hypothetical protein
MGVLSIRPQLTEEALDYSAEVGRLRLNEEWDRAPARVMPKYLTMVSYTPEGIKGLVKEGGTARRENAGEFGWPSRGILFCIRRKRRLRHLRRAGQCHRGRHFAGHHHWSNPHQNHCSVNPGRGRSGRQDSGRLSTRREVGRSTFGVQRLAFGG